jgi:DNA topoisomerase-1
MGPLGFKYYSPTGKLIRSASELERLRALAVPPAWTDVWICRDPRGHIQATGRDARGRKQYRYHPDWRACRDETKYERLAAFARALPRIRRRTHADLRRQGLPREKVLATVVQLLEKSLIRVGNDEYARENESFGLTTLRNRHVNVRGSTLIFEFKGKSGVHHRVNVNDRRLASIVRQCRELPGQELFEYFDEHGKRQDVGSADVNQYLREIGGEAFTAKDFRTWAGTVLAVVALQALPPGSTKAQTKRNLLQAIDAVSGMLRNTKAVCRKSYIHPRILDGYTAGTLLAAIDRHTRAHVRHVAGLKPEEELTLALLRTRAARLPAVESPRRKAA